VLSIKQTLYRTNENSPIVRALIEAAQTKEVTVVVSSRRALTKPPTFAGPGRWKKLGYRYSRTGRFENPLQTGAAGPAGAGRRDSAVRSLGHRQLHPSTAHFYSDLSLLTCDPEVTSAVHAVFNFLTARSDNQLSAPLCFAHRSGQELH